MRELIKEFRLLIAERFLIWAFEMAPNDSKEELMIANFVYEYTQETLKDMIDKETALPNLAMKRDYGLVFPKKPKVK